MITKLINFIGNKKIFFGIIFIITISIINTIFFSTTKKEFDTDGDGKIDKVEYYRKGVKVKELIYYDKAIPKGVEYIFWNKDSEVDKIVKVSSEQDTSYYSKYIIKYDKGINVHKYGKDYIKQKFIFVKVVDRDGKTREVQLLGDYYVYSIGRKIFFKELFELKNKRLANIVFYDENSRIKQVQEDKDSNGKFEYYEFYEHGKKTAVGYDYDEDGEIDKKEEVKNKQKE